MTEILTSDEMFRLGWKRKKSVAGMPRLIDPDGVEYTRTVFGMPDIVMIGESGQRHHLSRVRFRSARSLLRVMGVPGPSYGAP